MTVAVSLLERTNTNLSQWADHKRNSGEFSGFVFTKFN